MTLVRTDAHTITIVCDPCGHSESIVTANNRRALAIAWNHGWDHDLRTRHDYCPTCVTQTHEEATA